MNKKRSGVFYGVETGAGLADLGDFELGRSLKVGNGFESMMCLGVGGEALHLTSMTSTSRVGLCHFTN